MQNPPLTRRFFCAGALACTSTRASAAVDRFAPAVDRARNFDQLHCLVVAHKGQVVVEDAVRGPAPSRPVNVKSVSKTIVASLLGVAIDRGDVSSVRATLGEVAPGLIPPGADPRVAEITLEDLVTLRAGLERTSGTNYGTWVSSANWVADALSRDFVATPGGRMLYSTGSTHVLGAALAVATGQTLLAQARTRLGDPMGFEIPAWTRDPQGFYLGGNQMALSPRSMLRFGEMWRQKGRWNDEKLLSDTWVSQSLTPRTRSLWSGLGYGYGWFLTDRERDVIALARGYGGQIIAVAPEAELTIAITSDPTQPARSGGYFADLMSLLRQIVRSA